MEIDEPIEVQVDKVRRKEEREGDKKHKTKNPTDSENQVLTREDSLQESRRILKKYAPGVFK